MVANVEESPFEEAVMKFTEKMAIVNSNNEQLCFELSEREYVPFATETELRICQYL